MTGAGPDPVRQSRRNIGKLFHTDRSLTCQGLFYHLRHRIIGCGSNDAVNLRHFLLDLFFVAFRQTPCRNKYPAGSLFFILCHFQKSLDALLLGVVNKRTGIDHDYIGLLWLLRQAVSRMIQYRQHLFTVYQIFVTTK